MSPDRSTQPEISIRPPVAASLAILGTGVFVGALALGLAAAGGSVDARAVVLGIIPALAPCLLPTGVFAIIGRQPAQRFGYVVLALAGVRVFISLGAMLAVWLTVSPQRGGFLLGFLSVAGATLVAEKLVALLALRPAWALPAERHVGGDAEPAGAHA